MTPIDGLDPMGLLLRTAYGVGPALLCLWVGFRPLGDRLDAWAEARGVPLTAETRPWVHARLHQARRWRATGATIGWVLPYAELWVRRSAHDTGGDALHAVVGGYVLGALVAELVAARRAAPSGAAVLSTRTVDDYLPARVRAAAQLAAGLSAAIVVAHQLLPRRTDAFTTPTDLALRAAIVVGGLLVVEAVPRLLVRRRQPFRSSDLLRADDALRSWSAHAVAGGVLAGMLLVVAEQLWGIVTSSDAQVIRWAWALALLPSVAALAAFTRLTAYETGWRVPRWLRPAAA